MIAIIGVFASLTYPELTVPMSYLTIDVHTPFPLDHSTIQLYLFLVQTISFVVICHCMPS